MIENIKVLYEIKGTLSKDNLGNTGEDVNIEVTKHSVIGHGILRGEQFLTLEVNNGDVIEEINLSYNQVTSKVPTVNPYTFKNKIVTFTPDGSEVNSIIDEMRDQFKATLSIILSIRETELDQMRDVIEKLDNKLLSKKVKEKDYVFTVVIEETLRKEIKVTDCSSKEEAISKVGNRYHNEEIVLNYDDHVDTNFKVSKYEKSEWQNLDQEDPMPDEEEQIIGKREKEFWTKHQDDLRETIDTPPVQEENKEEDKIKNQENDLKKKVNYLN